MANDISYDATSVFVTIDGTIISGFRDGDKVSIERGEQLWLSKVGVDGAVVRSKNNKSVMGTITIGMMYGQDSNLVLQGLLTADQLSGLVPVSVGIFDAGGGYLAVASKAWFRNDPTMTFSGEPSDVEWVLDCAKLETFQGKQATI